MSCKKVKDKRINVENAALFLATVEYFQDTQQRDDHVPKEKTFLTMQAAQKWLAGFPRDTWDGYDTSDFNYREPDEGMKRHVRPRVERQDSRDLGMFTIGGDRSYRITGRELVGSMRRVH